MAWQHFKFPEGPLFFFKSIKCVFKQHKNVIISHYSSLSQGNAASSALSLVLVKLDLLVVLIPLYFGWGLWVLY